MFGYININQKELSEESKKIYQAYYCGLCQKLKTNCGTKGQMLLSYDLTFLIVLLTGLYELENTETEFTSVWNSDAAGSKHCSSMLVVEKSVGLRASSMPLLAEAFQKFQAIGRPSANCDWMTCSEK